MKKINILLSLALVVALVLTGCGGSSPAEDTDKIKVGVTAGPHEVVLEKVKELAALEGLTVEVITFNDYVQPNIQLADGNLDLNSFQHQPFFDTFITDRNLSLVKIGNSFNLPMGIYSQKVSDVADLQEGAQIGLPNDPTNGARALMLLEEAGLIKLKDGVGASATVNDVVENSKNLRLIELEAPIILQTLPDLDAAAINTNFIIQAGKNPANDSIFLEPADSPWGNIIVVREGEENNPLYQKFVEIYNSDAVAQFINDTYEGAIVPAW